MPSRITFDLDQAYHFRGGVVVLLDTSLIQVNTAQPCDTTLPGCCSRAHKVSGIWRSRRSSEELEWYGRLCLL